MRTFIFKKGNETKIITANSLIDAWAELAKEVVSTIDWKLQGSQG